MLYRRFGKTELQMPVFSCGGMRYQHKWGDADPSEIDPAGQANLEATIRRALEVGINHIETARGYGSSEMQLGYILPKLPREKMIVQTKVAPFEDVGKFVETFNKSMDYLKLDHVDLLGIHGINDEQTLEWAIRPGGCLEAARKFQAQGRVRHVGFSTHANLPTILKAIAHEGDGGFDYVNLHWYYILQRNWPAIEAATQRDMGVFIISPSDKGGKLYEPPAKLVELCQPLEPMVFNDTFCLSRPQVHTLSIGAARPSDFDAHLKTLDVLDQADEILPPIIARLEAAMTQATGQSHPETHIRQLKWHDQMPGGLAVDTILWLYNLARGWDMIEYGKMRYNLLGSGGHWFPGKNVEVLDDIGEQAVIDAMAGSPLTDRVIRDLRDAHELLAAEKVKRLSESD